MLHYLAISCGVGRFGFSENKDCLVKLTRLQHEVLGGKTKVYFCNGKAVTSAQCIYLNKALLS